MKLLNQQGAKGSAKDSKGKKKPGKDPGIDMRSDPPIKTEVGSYTVPLASFVEGESLFKKSCYCGGGPMPEVTIDENATPAGGLVSKFGKKKYMAFLESDTVSDIYNHRKPYIL